LAKALILAGGKDATPGSKIPKQFIMVSGRPVFIYALAAFQAHRLIDGIFVVCLNGWQAMVDAYCQQFNITKLQGIVTGGATGQDSSRIGIESMKEHCNADDLVVIHDSIRPLVSAELISNSIEMCEERGMGVSAITSMDAFMRTGDGKTGYSMINRYELMRVQTPQSYKFSQLQNYFDEAKQKGVVNQMDVSTMISAIGHEIYFSKGSDLNLKINNTDDITMFKALI
jgi:2-C-methyl-D-erythritol 4-phosphate cytidylyltransferase